VAAPTNKHNPKWNEEKKSCLLQCIREQQTHAERDIPAKNETKMALAIKDFENIGGERIDAGQRFSIASILPDDNKADFFLSLQEDLKTEFVKRKLDITDIDLELPLLPRLHENDEYGNDE
jgi:hypothetical protein